MRVLKRPNKEGAKRADRKRHGDDRKKYRLLESTGGQPRIIHLFPGPSEVARYMADHRSQSLRRITPAQAAELKDVVIIDWTGTKYDNETEGEK